MAKDIRVERDDKGREHVYEHSAFGFGKQDLGKMRSNFWEDG